MAMRAVDLDLFVNSFDKGYKAGAAVPSPFAAFSGGFFGGLDASQKYQTEEQQQIIRQNQIDQLPVENSIRESQAAIQAAQAQGATADATALAVENDLAKKRLEATIIKQKTDLDALLQTGDTKAMGEAYTSGQFNQLFTYDPKIRENFVTQTYPGWEPKDREVYQSQEALRRQSETYDRLAPKIEETYIKAENELLSNPDIAEIMSQIGEGKISPSQFAEKGVIKYETIREPNAVIMKKDENGKDTDIVEREYYDPSLATPTSLLKTKEVPVFYYNGEKIPNVKLNKEGVNAFNNFKSAYQYKNKLNEGMGSITDLNAQAKANDLKKQAAEAAAKAQASEDFKQVQDAARKFQAGASIEAPYRTPAKKVFEERAKNLEPKAPEVTGNNVEQSVPTSPDRLQDAAFSTVQALNRSRTGRDAVTEDRIKNAQSGQYEPKPTWVRNIEVKKQLQASKAQERLNKYLKAGKTPPPMDQAISPQKQADAVNNSSFIPENISVRSPYPVKKEAVLKVASRPEVQGFSALTKAVMVQESAGRADAVSETGVEGLMQVTEGTARGISKDIDRTDPIQSVLAGAIELERLMTTPSFKGNPMLTLTAYNGGLGVAQEAVRLAGSTDWEVVKNYLEAAVKSPKFTAEWKRLGINPDKKAKEVREYAEKVIANFPPFITSNTDMAMANSLKQQGVLVF